MAGEAKEGAAMSGVTRTVSVALKLAVQDYVVNGGKAVATNKKIGDSVDGLAKTHKLAYDDIKRVSLGVGGALLAVAAYSVKAAYQFDKQMSEVQAVSGATADQLGQLRDAAIEAGKATIFSATDAAKAEAELAKAGVSTSDILGGALTGSLALASAGQMDLADSATIAAQAMNVFGLHGKDVTHIADVLASAANASAADMQGLGDSIKQGGLVAAQTGMSLEDTVGVLSAFADHALVGADAGTSMKTMLQALQAPSMKTKDLMNQLGISAYDTSGQFIGITALAGELQNQLGGLTQAERDNALAQIFGTDATRAASILYREGATGIANYITKVNQNGAAAQTAAQKMNNLAGDVEQLKGSFETLAIESSGGVTKGLRMVTEAATATLNVFIDLPTPITETATVLAGVGGAALLGTVGFVKLAQTAKNASDILKGMGEGGPKLITFLTTIGRTAGPIAGAALAAGLFATVVAELLKNDMPKFKPAARNVDELTQSLKYLADTGKVAGYLAQTMGANLKQLALELQQVGRSAKDMLQGGSAVAIASLQEQMDHLATQGASDMKAINESLINLLNTAGASTANLAFDDISKKLQDMGVPLSVINKDLGGYLDAANNVDLANKGAAKGFANASQQIEIMNGSLETGIERGETFTDVWKELNGALFNTDQARLAAQKAIDDVTESLKKNGKEWKGNSEAALENRIAIGQAAEKAAEAAQAKYEETGSVADANKVYDDYIGKLRKVLLQAGLTKSQVDDLLTAYAKMPPSVTTQIHTPGLSTAVDQAGNLLAIIRHLPNGKTVRITVKTDGHGSLLGGALNRWGGVYEHAATGLLNEASTYSSANPGRYMIAEPQTGGEAFVPRRGDYGRSMSILGQAASWYGAMVVPRGGMGGGVTVQINAIASDPGGRQLLQQIRYVVDQAGGDPVKVLTPRRR